MTHLLNESDPVTKILADTVWPIFGVPLLRIYLTGEVQAERNDRLLKEADLAGRQGRLAFAFLALERERAVPQSELAEVLWPDSLPPSWPVALSAVISKLRGRLGSLGLDRERILPNAFRCYQFRPEAEAWIDIEAATGAVDAAEGAILRRQPAAAYGPSLIATTIARRPFLTGEDAPWIAARRGQLREILVRALDCRVEALVHNGETALALQQAREAVRLEPFRESGYRRLMQVLAGRGDRAEAVRAYEDCRRLLKEELDVAPSAETEALLRSLMA
jgi:SARP family transcriptional regulator, regulator of embCAB operon